MNEYKVEFKDGAAAGFPANSIEQAHKIARDYSSKSWYILYRRADTVKGWLRVGDNYENRV